MASLRTSPLSWCGNPPVLPGAYRYVSPLNQGIPTPVCATSRNDSVISVFQLLIRIWGEGLELQYETFPLGGRWQPEGLTDEGKPWRFPQLPDQLECARMPQRNAFPRGEGAPARGRMRNGDLFRIGMHFVKKVHWERLYRLNEPRCEWEGVAIPHPPLRGPPSPRGKVLGCGAGAPLPPPVGEVAAPRGLTERVSLGRSITFGSPPQSKIKDFCQLPQRGSQGDAVRRSWGNGYRLPRNVSIRSIPASRSRSAQQ